MCSDSHIFVKHRNWRVEKCHLTPQVLWDLRNGLFSLIDGLKANRHGIFKIQYMSHKDTVQAIEKKAWVISWFCIYSSWSHMRWTEDSSECSGQRWIVETSTVCISHQITSYSRLNIFIEGTRLFFKNLIVCLFGVLCDREKVWKCGINNMYLFWSWHPNSQVQRIYWIFFCNTLPFKRPKMQ